MSFKFSKLTGKRSILVEEQRWVRFDNEIRFPDLETYEPNYYQLKLHVDLPGVINDMFTTGGLLNEVIDGIVSSILSKGVIEEGADYSGLSNLLYDFYNVCLTRIGISIGTLDFKLISCHKFSHGNFVIVLSRWT